MEKEKLNSQVILMRPAVRHAKRSLNMQLHKKVKSLEELKKKSENPDRAQKFTKQINNLLETLKYSKMVNIDDVSKLALKSNPEVLAKIISTKADSMEIKALARLALKERVQKTVTTFREANPDWEKWINATLELWEMTRTKKENTKREMLKKFGGPKHRNKKTGGNREQAKTKVIESNKVTGSGKKSVDNKLPEESLSKQVKKAKKAAESFQANNKQSKVEPVVKKEEKVELGVSARLRSSNNSNQNKIKANNDDKVDKVDTPKMKKVKIEIKKEANAESPKKKLTKIKKSPEIAVKSPKIKQEKLDKSKKLNLAKKPVLRKLK